MTDRELLKLAAKAAGMQALSYNEDMKSLAIWDGADSNTLSFWNPLEDDGDALRLMVALRIEVEPWIHGDSDFARAAVGEVLIDERHNGDPLAATRCAIVRAAATIASQAWPRSARQSRGSTY